MTRVYASLPLSGPQGALGRAVLRGAEAVLYDRLAVQGGELVWDTGPA